MVGKVIHLRQHYHFGPQKISMYLKRYHDVDISVSGVWRILKRLDMNRLPSSKRFQRHERRWKRYEKQQALPVENDIDRIFSMGIQVVTANLLQSSKKVRHDPVETAQVVVRLAQEGRRLRLAAVERK